jgi:predicted transcriptional regulator
MRRPAPAREIPPPLELACLRTLWGLNEATVHAVRNVMNENAVKPLAYTTVMTLLDRLVQRGAASRRKKGRAFLYQPRATREALREAALGDLVEGYFNGSEAALLEYLRSKAAGAIDISRSRARSGVAG